MSPGTDYILVRELRDEFSRLRAHLFEAVEAAGWPDKQERGWKGVIRSISYQSQAALTETAMRRGANHMGQPGVTSQHTQAARQAVYGPPPEEPAPETEEASAETIEAEAETKASTSKK
jgi:hypothetical protein